MILNERFKFDVNDLLFQAQLHIGPNGRIIVLDKVLDGYLMLLSLHKKIPICRPRHSVLEFGDFRVVGTPLQ